MPYYEPTVVERIELGALTLLTLASPELAHAARPGHYVLARCAPPASADPLLRRPLFLAAADPGAGTVQLLIERGERGLDWLAAQPTGAWLDLFGPLGTTFNLDGRSRNLLLAGSGPALPALIFLARSLVGRDVAVVLLAAAAADLRLPPPFLLPADVEYQSSAAAAAGLLELLKVSPSPLQWADQLCLALEEAQIADIANLVRAARLRWERGYAQVALSGSMPCGSGACQSCLIETRNGLRTRCKDGPVFDLRELRG